MNNSQTLDGNSVTYKYPELGTVKIDFYNGLLKYEWLEGHFKGVIGEGHTYQSKLIGDQMYMFNWLEKPHYSFITVVLNLGQNTMQSSAILNPQSEQEMSLFHSGNILSHTMT
jgi:hypothetical protein